MTKKQIDKTLQLMEGSCSECGQIKMVSAANAVDADYKATMECRCEAGRVKRASLRVASEVCSVCGEASEMLGFTKMSDEVMDLVHMVAMSCMREEIIQAQIKVDDSVLTMTRKAAGIGIQRSKKIEIGQEVAE